MNIDDQDQDMNVAHEFLPIKDIVFEYAIGALSEMSDWGLLYTNISAAHKHTKGRGITVAVLDTGYSDHIDLHDNLLPPLSSVDGGSIDDRVGHGTHVQGIVGACANGIGIIGVAPECKILSIKVLGDSGHSTYYEIAKGIQTAIENKADIINLSLGCSAEPPPIFHDIIKRAYDQGIIIVAAAGNDAGAVNFPAKYNEVIAVAAMGQDGKLARFSSHGPEIEALAPGVNIYSTVPGNQYAIMNGTSQASPFIAGTCALLMSWARSHPNARQIKSGQDMLKALDDLCDPQGRVIVGTEGDTGFGIPQFANYMPWKEDEVSVN
jgi:subtilisin family serine protease